MQLVTNVYAFLTFMEDEDIVRMVAEAGFDGIDWSFMRQFGENSPWMQENWREHAQMLVKTAKECGVSFRQGHAPYPTTRGDAETDAMIMLTLRRSIEAAAAMGIPYLVVHPCQHTPYNVTRDALFAQSVDMYRQLLPLAQELGVVLCTENMWQRDKGRKVIVESICARPEEFCQMVDTLDSPYLRACLDIGHGPLVSQDPAFMVRTLGKDRLKALHIHDVDLHNDSHTIPFAGKVNWQEVVQALVEIGYDGDFTFETVGWFAQFPQALWPQALKMAHDTGRYLIDQIKAGQA